MIENANDEIYISYIKLKKTPFKKELIKTNLQTIINKPACALWGSPLNAIYGWKEWCFDNDFDIDIYDWDNPIKWKLKENSKILRISISDVCDKENSCLNKYISLNEFFKDCPISFFYDFAHELDFKKMKNDDIVAVELMNASIGHRFINSLEGMFNSWDCESIVVLDESKIEML